MNFDSLSLSTLFEKSLLRICADFDSTKSIGSVQSELRKDLKRRVSSSVPDQYNIQLIQSEDGKFHLSTNFLLYRDARLLIISLLKWIERNGSTSNRDNFFVDLKFIDQIKGPFKGTLFNTSTKIENIDKLKFILEFDENRAYSIFPFRRNWYTCQTIQKFEPIQKFIPKESKTIDPRFYQVNSDSNSGINFQTLIEGYLRMQYIGGVDYDTKTTEILGLINEFCITSWNCTINKGFTKENIQKFQKLIEKTEKIRESYLDYSLFKKNFSKINFTVDLLDNDKLLESYFNILRDRLYDLLINIEYKGDLEINYDSAFCTFQIKDADIKILHKIQKIEFINCKLNSGILENCDIYDCKIKNSSLIECNLFRFAEAEQSALINSVVNRTSSLIECEFSGTNGVLNGKMLKGIFKNGKVGLFADISKETKVLEYQKLKSGYFVAGDQIIIPTKKFRKQ